MSSLNNIGKKARDSNMYCTPRHITTSLQKWALITRQKFASPLDFDPSNQAYWIENTRDSTWSKHQCFRRTVHRLLLLPPDLLRLSPAFTCGTCTSINNHTCRHMHTNALKKLQQHSYSSLTGLVGVRTGT